MRKGAVGIATLISVVMGAVTGAAVSVVWVVSYVNTAVAPVQAQANSNTTEIASISKETDDTNQKVNALYDFFLNKGLTAQESFRQTSSSLSMP
jgi:hypothetical protein